MSQRSPTLNAMKLLLAGHRINTASFCSQTGYWRLPVYVYAIKKQEKWNIQSRRINDPATRKRTAEYWLSHEEIKHIKETTTVTHANEHQSLTKKETK